MKIDFKLLFVCIFLVGFNSCKLRSQESEHKIIKKDREYLVHEIDSTKRYFILNTTFENEPVILVVFKKSKQLADKKIIKEKEYKFNTYRAFDAINPSLNYYHEVDGKEIWNSDLDSDLHFTDGMGNGYLESKKEIEAN